MLKASKLIRPQVGFLLALIFCLRECQSPLALTSVPAGASPAQPSPASQVSTDDEEQSVLSDALRSAGNNPQVLIKHLEDFLARFPQSSRRERVLRTICSYAQQANAPDALLRYGPMLLEITPDDPHLLTVLIDALAGQNDQASRARAIEYSSHLLAIAQSHLDQAIASGPSDTAREQWTERVAAMLAERAGFYRASGDLEKAIADDEKSFATRPTAGVAEQLGDLALAKGDTSRALNYYLTAFVLPDDSLNPSRRRELRRKLGSVYLTLHHSQHGLGDSVLARYDALTPQLSEHLSGNQVPNAGRHDPFEYVLEQINGTPLPMSAYRGKVLFVDFWATWCGHCRLQGKLIEQVASGLRGNSNAAFLSVNVDQDRSGVPAFLKHEGWTIPTAFAQGLDQLLEVRAIPTVVIFDRQGRIVFRQEGFDPESFVEQLSKHLRETLQEPEGTVTRR